MKRRILMGLIAIGLLAGGFGVGPPRPVNAQGAGLVLTVNPNNTAINVGDISSQVLPYYVTAAPLIVVSSSHTQAGNRTWYLGIRAAAAFLTDGFGNQIPIAKLQWSRDGSTFTALSQTWVQVNSYRDLPNRTKIENITYRLLVDTDITAGTYTVTVSFDVQFSAPPTAPPWPV